jgi:hypothetical protein
MAAMTSRDRSHSGQLFLVQNWLAEATWQASDEELLEDLKGTDRNLDAESLRFQEILKRAEIEAGKARFAAAKAAAERDRARIQRRQGTSADPQAARALLTQVAANNPQFREKLMLAARNAKTSVEKLPDNDIQTLIEMAQELGLLPDDRNA